ncbi:MAG: ribosome recycling factor [Candidatus Omnitrophica bacterium]|nr:ribosome recycling factor [Candidatus Omnitrophota bacterium]
MEIIHQIEEKMKKTLEVTTREFAGIRTGRASTALVDGVKVDYYGNPMPLKQLATITTPDPRLLAIQPWDVSLIPEIEKAILKSELGITPVNDGKVVRLSMPSLTQERRDELDKLIKKMAEDGRVSVRSERRLAVDQIKKLEKEKKVSEDDSFRTQGEIQKLTDRYIQKIEELLKVKEKEIKEI